jgi:hypothetical protein
VQGPIRRQTVRKRLKKAGDDDKGRSRALPLDESLFGSDGEEAALNPETL